MRQKYRTSCYRDIDVDLLHEDSVQDRAHSSEEFVGFRLAFDSEDRVPRGGSWDDTAVDARAAYRGRSGPGNRGVGLGFRLVFDRGAQ